MQEVFSDPQVSYLFPHSFISFHLSNYFPIHLILALLVLHAVEGEALLAL